MDPNKMEVVCRLNILASNVRQFMRLTRSADLRPLNNTMRIHVANCPHPKPQSAKLATQFAIGPELSLVFKKTLLKSPFRAAPHVVKVSL